MWKAQHTQAKFGHFLPFFDGVQNCDVKIDFQSIGVRISAYHWLTEQIEYMVNGVEPRFVLLQFVECQVS